MLPQQAQKKPQLGIVVGVGPGAHAEGHFYEPDFEIGEQVFYSQYGGIEVEFEGRDYLILEARDIIAKVIDDDA